MKRSLSIFRVLAVVLMLCFAGSTIQAVASHDLASAKVSLSAGVVIAPLAAFSFVSPQKKKTEWRKDGPMLCLLTIIQPAQSNVNQAPRGTMIPMNQDPRISGIMPGEQVVNGGGQLATGANNGISAPIEAVFADFAVGRVLSFGLTIATTYGGGVIPLLPQLSSDTLPTGVTLASGSSAFSTFAAMVAYLTNIKNLYVKLVVTADNTSNFDQNIVVTKTHPDGNTSVVRASWNQLALDPYAQVQTVRTIEKRFVSGSDVRYEFISLVPGSGTYSWTFRFEAAGVANSFLMRRPEF